MKSQSSSSFFRDFKKLDTGLKMVFFGSIIALVSVFLPVWFQSSDWQIVDGIMTTSRTHVLNNAFSDFPVFGILSFIVSATALFVFSHHLFGHTKTFGFKNSHIWIFLGAQALFLLSICFFVMSSVNQHYDDDASLRFGFYITFFAHFFMGFGGYLYIQTEKKETARKYFSPSPNAIENIDIRAEEPNVSKNQLSLADTNE